MNYLVSKYSETKKKNFKSQPAKMSWEFKGLKESQAWLHYNPNSIGY